MPRTKPDAEQSTFPDGLSCEICLVADDPADMLHFDVEVVPDRPVRTAHICRKCIAAILVFWFRQVELESADQGSEGDDQS